MNKDNSAPAFPSDSNEFGSVLGMSLRDYFAAKALPGLIAGAMSDGSIWDEESASMASQHAYVVADAMLAARSA